MPYTENERRECELFYMKQTFKDFLNLHQIKELQDIQDPRLCEFVMKDHPRWFALVEKFGSPLDTVSIQKEGTNISNSSAKVSLISEIPETEGKKIDKKLLLSMTVSSLKAICSKLFKVEPIKQLLVYQEDGYEGDYPFDEDERQLSFFSVKDGGRIICRHK